VNDVTEILSAIEQGDLKAAEQLLPLVYDELRKLAARRLAHEQPGQTLQPTELVNEAFLRLVGPSDERKWESQGHFFAAAAEAMRRILVERARQKGREKHGGGRRREYKELDDIPADGSSEELLALHEALQEFALHDPLKAKLVELRFFAGLTQEQAGALLGISRSTADRAWRYARAWLYTAIANPDLDSEKKENPA